MITLLEVRETREWIHFTNIYAPVLYSEKVELWNSLDILKERNMHLNCVIRGDFDTILSNAKRRGRTIVRDPFKDRMEDLIDDWYFLDVIPKVGKYTWSNR